MDFHIMSKVKVPAIGVALLVCISNIVYGQSIPKPPTDVTGILGEKAVFHCGINFGHPPAMSWDFNGKTIYTFYGGIEKYTNNRTDKYSVKYEDSDFSLTVKNLKYEDGGKYNCITIDIHEAGFLIVLGEPSLFRLSSSPVEGETALYECEAHFGGPSLDEISKDLYPFVRMFFKFKVEGTFSETIVKDLGSSYRVEKEYHVRADAKMNGKKLVCAVSTTNPPMTVTSFIKTNVLYPVRNITYSPQQNSYEVGSKISCTADGNPDPTFEWINSAINERAVNSSWLYITHNMTGKHEWKCTSRNYINGKLYDESVTAVFEILSQPEKGIGASVFVVIFLLLGFLCFSAIFGYIFWRRTKNRNTKKMEQLNMIEDKSQITSNTEYGLNETDSLVRECEGTSQCEEDVTPHHLLREVVTLSSQNLDVEPHSETGDTKSEDAVLKFLEETKILKHSTFFSEIMKILREDTSGTSKSDCLRTVICHSEYISKSNDCFKWSQELFTLLKLLFDEGADPTWIPSKDLEKLEKKEQTTAQDKFFTAIVKILLFKNELFDQLQELVQLFMHGGLGGISCDALHALVKIDWKRLNEQSSFSDFFQKYTKCISEVIKHDISIINKTDSCGRTILHVFLQGMELHKDNLGNFVEIVQLLTSNSNLKISDSKGRCVLHYLAEALPSINLNVLNEGKSELYSLINELTDKTNLCLRDENGCTVLHILANKYDRNISELVLSMLLRLHSKSNVDIQDNQGCTVLHILAEKFPKEVPENGTIIFLNVMKCLITNSCVNVKDSLGQTFLHRIVNNYTLDMPLNLQDMLLELFKIAGSKENSEKKGSFDIQDKDGGTVLHILTRKCGWQEPETVINKYHELLKYLAKYSSKDIRDKQGNTILRLIVTSSSNDMPEHYFKKFSDLVKIFLTPSTVRDDKSFVLQPIIDKYSHEVSEENRKLLKELKDYNAEMEKSSKNIEFKGQITELQISKDSHAKKK